MEEKKKGKKHIHTKKKEVQYIIDAPKSYFEHCLENAKSEEQAKELKKILKLCD